MYVSSFQSIAALFEVKLLTIAIPHWDKHFISIDTQRDKRLIPSLFIVLYNNKILIINKSFQL